MVFVLGAVSSALDAFKSLTSSTSSSQTNGSSQVSANPFDLSANTAPTSANPTPTSGSNGVSQIAPPTLGALLAAQSQSSSGTAAPASPSNALQDFFHLLDANGDGQISKSEFENALDAGGTNIANADKVFGELDKNGDGSVSLGELSSVLKGAGGKGHHHHAHIGDSDGSGDSAGAAGANNADALLQALQVTSGTTVTNSDGSTTTTLKNADGSTITLTTPVASSGATSSAATSSYNFIEQLIQRAAQGFSTSATASPLSLSV
jgi:hypothetical protein